METTLKTQTLPACNKDSLITVMKSPVSDQDKFQYPYDRFLLP